MNLEDQIDQAFKYFREGRSINILGWCGSPYTSIEYTITPSKKRSRFIIVHLHKRIENADLAECLTSPSEYIRKYREWYELRKLDK